jgi:FkbM family methyltransferase
LPLQFLPSKIYELLRHLFERFSRNFVFKRRLPSEFGHLPLYVSPAASLRYWLAMPKVDPVLYQMAKELVRPGACVWDVGANVGLFSFCAAALAGQSGQVLAIEPDLWLANLLLKSAQHWRLKDYAAARVDVLCAAASDGARVERLQIAARARASNYLSRSPGNTQTGGTRFSQPTVSLTLDFLLEYFSAPSVLKIDVETHETEVLNGARHLLKTHRPVVWCEVSFQSSPLVTDIFHSLGYQLFNPAEKERVPIERATWNTLAIPL